MNLIQTRYIAFAFTAISALSSAAFADPAKGHEHQKTSATNSVNVASDANAVAAADADMTSAEVRKVDKDSKKITLKHEAIKSLDMPGMTMVFQVKDAALLDKAKAGDKVKVKVIKEGNAYVVTEIRAKE